MNVKLITRKFTSKNLLLSLSLGIILPLIPGLGAVTFAQTAADLGTSQPFPSNEIDPVSGNSSGSIADPVKLMQMMMLNNGRSMEQFMLDSRNEMNNAADDFKLRQKEMFLNRQAEKDDDRVAELE